VLVAALRLGAIGDTLLAAPALVGLRRAMRGARVGLLGRRDVGDLLWRCGVLSAVADTESSLARWLLGGSAEAREAARNSALARPALAVVWRRDGGAEIGTRWQELGAGRSLCAPSHPPDGARRHIADHLLDTLASLGVNAPGSVTLALPPDLRERGRTITEGLGVRAPFFVLHPGSGGAAKRWQPARFAALGRALERRARVLLVCGPADDDAVRGTLDAAGRAWPVLALPALADLAGVLAVARAYVGNDSGPSHLAALLGCPTAALYGPTDPAVWGVRGPRALCVLPRGIDLADWRPLPIDAVAVDDVLRALHALGVIDE
jgi:heptosyltransferase-3